MGLNVFDKIIEWFFNKIIENDDIASIRGLGYIT